VRQAVSPRRRRGAEVALAGPQSEPVERGDHQRHHRAMRVLHRLRQLARGAGGVLEQSEVRRGRRGRVIGAFGGELGPERVIGADHLGARVLCSRRVSKNEAGLAIVQPQRQSLRPEQREHRHGDGAALHGAEHADVEGERGLDDHGDAIALGDAAALEPVGEAPGEIGELRKIVVLAATVGELDADRRAFAAVAVDAFVREVHARLVAVEQRPEYFPREAAQHLVVGGELEDAIHGRASGSHPR